MRLWITGESGATAERYLCSATSVELKHTMVEMAFFLFVRPLRSGVLGPSDHCTCKHVDDYDYAHDAPRVTLGVHCSRLKTIDFLTQCTAARPSSSADMVVQVRIGTIGRECRQNHCGR